MTRRRIAVVVWDLSSNAASWAFFLAGMLARNHDVELVGARFGDALWGPAQDSALPIRAVEGATLPELADVVDAFTRGIDADLIYACKPRLPTLLLASAIKQRTGAPVVVHVDDLELGFVGAADGISLTELEHRTSLPDFRAPGGESWTRACDALIADADAVTVSNEPLQRRYGGTIVPHARDELLFDPDGADRDEVRREFGYSETDRVILFAGVPRPHKGIVELARAVGAIDDPRVKLCVLGSFVDRRLRAEVAALAGDRLQLIETRPASEMPRLLRLGDLACLLQDADDAIATYQTPGKLTDALAMGLPVLARETLPLTPFVEAGVIRLAGAGDLAAQIIDTLADRVALKEMAERGRRLFLDQLSYAAVLETVEPVLAGLDDAAGPVPASWARLRELAAGVSAFRARPPRTPARQCPLCSHTARSFATHGGQPDVRCGECEALERDRLAWLYMLNETDLWAGTERRVLSVDQLPVLGRRLGEEPLVELVELDWRQAWVDPAGPEIPERDGSFDAVCCSRVLELVADDRGAIDELFRVLRPGGWALLQTRPLAAGITIEDPALVDRRERARRFGHELAIRRYGRDYPARLADAGFQVTVDPYPRRLGAPCQERFGLPIGEDVFLCRKPAAGAGGTVERLLVDAPDQTGPRAVAGIAPVIRGEVNVIDDRVVAGWVRDGLTSGPPPEMRIWVDGREAAHGVAERDPADGVGRFRIALPATGAVGGVRRLRVETDAGIALPASRRAVRTRHGAAYVLADTVSGRIEAVVDRILSGWAWQPAAPDRPVALRVILDGHEVAAGIADLVRGPPQRGDVANGRRGFRVTLPDEAVAVGPHSLRVEAADGTVLPAAATFARTDASASSFFVDGSARPLGRGDAHGRVEAAGSGVVRGWAWRPSTPSARIWVRVLVDGRDAGAGIADALRPQLADGGIGDGRHGFVVRLSEVARRGSHHTLRVETESGIVLDGAPDFASSEADGWPDYRLEVSAARYR